MKKLKKVTIVIVFLLIIGFIYFTKNFTGSAILSGMAIRNFSLFQKIDSFSLQTKVFLIQWVVLFLVVTFILTRHLKKRMKDKNKIQEKRIYVHNKGGKTYTDLDDLYKMLIANKKIKVSEIVKEFNICKDKALEWGKIFEDEGIVEINYPAFLEPEIKLKINKKDEDQEEDKEENKEETKWKCEDKKDEEKDEVEKNKIKLNKEEKKDDKKQEKQKKENNKEKK
jgi:hypothetical protein